MLPLLLGRGKGERGGRGAELNGSGSRSRFPRLSNVQPSNGSLPFIDLRGIDACSEAIIQSGIGAAVCILFQRLELPETAEAERPYNAPHLVGDKLG